MLNRNKQGKRLPPTNQFAHQLEDLSALERDQVQIPTKAQISLLMAQMGRKGGKKGGKRRLETMTPEERSDVARTAALTRWKKKRQSAGQAEG